MAIYNEILVARYASMIKKLFGMKGPNPTKQLAGEVAPALPLFSGAENRFLETWNRWGGIGDIGPTAANQSGIRLRNPSTSNIIAVIEKFTFSGNTTDSYSVQQGATAADLATLQGLQGNRLDSRTGVPNQGTASPTLVLSFQASAPAVPALAFTLWKGLLLANTNYDLIADENQELTLLPGDAIQVFANTVNERALAAFVWRERFLEESERQ